MQIFCDESGGVDQEHFLVTAVRIDNDTASRLIKTIRKALKIKDEIKGNHLTIEEIKIVFSILSKNLEIIAASVICGRNNLVGGWAFGNHEEHVVWRELIVESCLPLHKKDVRGVVPDGGRYKRAVIRSVESDAACTLARRTGLPTIPVSCAESAGTPGIQIADIISNVVYRSLGNFADATTCKDLLDQAQKAGQIQIRMLEMAEHQPHWLKKVIGAKAP